MYRQRSKFIYIDNEAKARDSKCVLSKLVTYDNQ